MEVIIQVILPLLAIGVVAGLYIWFLVSQRRRTESAAQPGKVAAPKQLPKSAPVIPYMEPVALNFFTALKQALPAKFIIYVNVPIEKLFEASRREALCMKGQYADFVIFTPDLMPVLVIDLFDMSIINLDRVNKIKNVSKEILRNSGIPVLDYRCTDTYNIDTLRRAIADLLNPLRVDSK